MSVTSEIQSLSPSATVELFVIDTTNSPGGAVMHFHAGTNALTQPVVWQGVSYSPFPIEAEGFDISSKGVLPRPRVRVANIGGMFSAEVAAFDDMVGSKVTRKRTFARYIDGVNFAGGVNPSGEADPCQHLPDDLWYIERKVSENRYIIEWELASAFDLQGVMLPGRQVIQNSCASKYRSAECGYTDTLYFDKNDVACGASGDFCAKRLSSCRARFGTGILPFGGFPGAVRYG